MKTPHIRRNSRTLIWVTTCLATITTAMAAPSFTQKPIENVGWRVDFTGSHYDPLDDTTRFSYLLTASAGEKDLSHWVLGLCTTQVPTGSGTLTRVGLDPTTGISGFKWDDGQKAGTTAIYSIVFAGHYGEADTEYAVKGGTYFAIGRTTGPTCEPLPRTDRYSISGQVFLDANANGVRDAGEIAMPNVTVNLADASANFLSTVMTDANGQYAFSDLLPGGYIVEAPNESADIVDDFNETLGTYFTATTPTSHDITLASANSPKHDFGFNVNSAAILADLNAADPDGDGFTLTGTGKTIGFWKHQNTVAIKGKGNAQISATTLKGYLMAVQALHLPLPFSFTAGNEYQDAFAVLSSTSSAPVDLLRKQLLATELNEVAGLGLSGTIDSVNLDQLQNAIIGWAEFLAANSSSYSASQLLAAKDICDLINNTGE